MTLTEIIEARLEAKKAVTEIIMFHEGCTLESALSYVADLKVTTMCFIGNYAGFVTDGLVVRLFCYDPEAKLWTVKDKDLSDGFEEAFYAKFTTDDLKAHPQFSKMMNAVGYFIEE